MLYAHFYICNFSKIKGLNGLFFVFLCNRWLYESYGTTIKPMSDPKTNAIHFPPELILLIDRTMLAKGGYSTRAEFVREAVRNACFDNLNGGVRDD